jgi:hypothetical protein
MKRRHQQTRRIPATNARAFVKAVICIVFVVAAAIFISACVEGYKKTESARGARQTYWIKTPLLPTNWK